MSTKDAVQSWMGQLLAWDTARKQDIARAGMALGYGLNPAEWARPFPGTPVNTTVNVAPQAPPPAPASNGIGKAAGAALLGLSLLGGTGAGFGVASLLAKPAAELEGVIESKGPDGRFSEIGRFPVKPNTTIPLGPKE